VVDALEGCAAAKLYMIDHDGLCAREGELNQAVVARGDNLRRVAGALDGVDVLPAAGANVLDLPLDLGSDRSSGASSAWVATAIASSIASVVMILVVVILRRPPATGRTGARPTRA
jgi:hypothetical protein